MSDLVKPLTTIYYQTLYGLYQYATSLLQISIIRIASSITDYLQSPGVNLSLAFSQEWTGDNWHNWKLKTTRSHTKDGKKKGAICKIVHDNAHNA